MLVWLYFVLFLVSQYSVVTSVLIDTISRDVFRVLPNIKNKALCKNILWLKKLDVSGKSSSLIFDSVLNALVIRFLEELIILIFNWLLKVINSVKSPCHCVDIKQLTLLWLYFISIFEKCHSAVI